ncbi:serine/threonine-protein kinase [Tahibacter amnicola]|uniref:Serine/threonine-protein kinase n=1 Tax=Tahibacter amnicola TaxID=2976241 RepID=A0ABY6BHQ2_9GAMM|nr:serine/threonine-protein kinase [Tahibacter amnicola]UXI69528.1 serine/threonine-protein kinase [Tahibacter amnicola]
MNPLLSTAQWQVLQDAFDASSGLAPEAQAALVETLRQTDVHVADALAAMLDANRQWLDRTLQARAELAAAMAPSAVGTRIGVYRLTAEVGRGGMGTVYRGERADGQIAQEVAIKVLHAHSLDANTRGRFQRERDILAAFDHPGIARLFCAGETEAGEPYYVMEYLRGQSILAHCNERRLGIRQRLASFLKVCEAVQYAHGKLVLHRDIKSSNVLTDSAGAPKLIDFGIAKALATITGVTAEQTALQHRYFSPINASPEQVRGDRASVACDVYQLGTLLYELLCGSPIFDLRGLSPTEVERRICDEEPTAPSIAARSAALEVAQARGLQSTSSLARALRGDLDAVVMRALRKEPEQRYTSVEQLVRDIERYLANQPILAHRGSYWYRTRRFFRRNWRSITAASTTAIGITVFTTLLMAQVAQTRAQRDHAVAEKNRAEAVTNFLFEIFRFKPSNMLRMDTPVREVLARGQEMLDERFANDPRAAAQLATALGNLYMTLDDLETAEVLGRRALHFAQSMPKPDNAVTAEVYRQLAGTLFNRVRFDEAAQAAEQSLALFAKEGIGYETSWYAKVILLRIERRKDEPEGCRNIDRFVDELRPLVEKTPIGFGELTDMAAQCGPDSIERLARKERDLRQALGLLTSILGSDHDSVNKLKRRLGSVLVRMNRLDEAEQLEIALLPEHDRLYGSSSWASAFSLMELGTIAYRRHQNEEALRRFRQAEEIFQRVHKDRPHANLAAVHSAIARVFHYGLDQPGKAAPLYAQALRIGRVGYGSDSAHVRHIEADYGTLIHRTGEDVLAEPLLRHAVEGLPGYEAAGARARISLATIVQERDTLLAANLLSEAEFAVAPACAEDSRLGERLKILRSTLEKRLASSASAQRAARSRRISESEVKVDTQLSK